MTAGAKVQIAGSGAGSGNATSIQGTPVSATPPTPGQTLVDVAGTYTPQTPASSAMSLISSQVLASPAASLTFSAIPGTFNHLKLKGNARSVAATIGNAFMTAIVNGDGGADYDVALTTNNGGVIATHIGRAASSIGNPSGDELADAGDTAGVFSDYEYDLPCYTNTAMFKNVGVYSAGYFDGTAALGDQQMYSGLATWRSLAAVTSITLAGNGGNLAAGTAFYLYGIT